MQELADQIWGNSRFHEAAALAHRTWLGRELGRPLELEVTMEEAVRLMQASAILACSTDPLHRRQAYRSATMTYEVIGAKTLPMQQALRVVLARLGNFPALETREEVGSAAGDLPLDLAIEEIVLSDRRRVLLRDRPALLTSFQHDLWSKLGEGRSVAVAAPTSAGKSFILQGHLARVFQEDGEHIVVYLVPTRALIAQVARDLADLFSGTESAPEIVTVPLDGDQPLPTRAIFVMTQERTQLMLAAHPGMSAGIVIVDEAHSIADHGRGVLLQWVVDDLLRRRSDAQLLFASPGIRNLDVFGRTFGLESVETLPSTEPTVAQNFLIVRVISSRQGEFSVSSIEPGSKEALVGEFAINQTIATKKERLVHISATLGRGAPTIVYANGAAEAEDLAIQLTELFADRETTPRRDAVAQLVAQSVHPSYVLAAAVRRGVGFHYSNMPTSVRQAVEDAFADGTIDFLVCTSTLLQGVNLPARNVFMCKPEKGKQRPLEGTDFWNLAGRAGRLRREFQGNIFLIDYDEWKAKPLDHARDSVIVPALQDGVTLRLEDLVATMADEHGDSRKPDGDLETLFIRLLDDHSRGELSTTLSRLIAAGVPSASTERVKVAIDEVVEVLTLPVEVVRQSPNLSPHRQQSLHAALLSAAGTDKASVRALIPAHPRESGAYASYVSVLRLCHTHLLGLPLSHGSHRYHALMAVFWMSGDPLPKIIESAINHDKKKSSRTVIRSTLETIEKVIRFEVVRLMSCYCAVLLQVLDEIGLSEMASSVPPLSLYLEVGASDRSMISFMGLGLSRVAAAILNDATVNKSMTIPEARVWLKDVNLDAYELSPLLVEEIRRVAR